MRITALIAASMAALLNPRDPHPALLDGEPLDELLRIDDGSMTLREKCALDVVRILVPAKSASIAVEVAAARFGGLVVHRMIDGPGYTLANLNGWRVSFGGGVFRTLYDATLAARTITLGHGLVDWSNVESGFLTTRQKAAIQSVTVEAEKMGGILAARVYPS